jgi:exopolysaccharide production protein ExoZ
MIRQIGNIQAMRGLAAMMVVLVHSIAIADSFTLGWISPFFGKWGPAGVDFFFVISGFVIATVANNSANSSIDNGRVNRAGEFIVKRLIRIFPIYWIVLIVAIFISPYVHLAPSTLSDKPLFDLFFLFELANNKIMASWTLVYEMYFYLVVTVLIVLFNKRIFLGLGIWACVTIVLILYHTLLKHDLSFSIPLCPMILEFMFGMLIAFLIDRKVNSLAFACISIGIVGFFVGAEINSRFGDWGKWYRTLCFGVPAALIIYGMVAAEVQNKIISSKYLQKLGDVSYSLYIWHQLVFASLFGLAAKAGLVGKIPSEIIVLGWICFVLVWAFMSYHLVGSRKINGTEVSDGRWGEIEEINFLILQFGFSGGVRSSNSKTFCGSSANF